MNSWKSLRDHLGSWGWNPGKLQAREVSYSLVYPISLAPSHITFMGSEYIHTVCDYHYHLYSEVFSFAKRSPILTTNQPTKSLPSPFQSGSFVLSCKEGKKKQSSVSYVLLTEVSDVKKEYCILWWKYRCIQRLIHLCSSICQKLLFFGGREIFNWNKKFNRD